MLQRNKSGKKPGSLLIECWNVDVPPYAFLFFCQALSVCVFAPEIQPSPRVWPLSCFCCFFPLFSISPSSTPNPPPTSSSSQHKLVLLSLPLILFSFPTIPSSLLQPPFLSVLFTLSPQERKNYDVSVSLNLPKKLYCSCLFFPSCFIFIFLSCPTTNFTNLNISCLPTCLSPLAIW